MLQWVKKRTAAAWVTVEIQVLSPAQRSGLKIHHYHTCGMGCSHSSDSIPDPRTSIFRGCGHWKEGREEGRKRGKEERKKEGRKEEGRKAGRRARGKEIMNA